MLIPLINNARDAGETGKQVHETSLIKRYTQFITLILGILFVIEEYNVI